MGQPKLLLPWHGRPVIRHVTETALAATLSEVIVVTGHAPDEIAHALAGSSVRVVHNSDYDSGLGSSLAAGVKALPGGVAAALIILGDQPMLTAAVIDRMIEVFHETAAPIVAAGAAGRRGNPVLFARELFPALQEITGDTGARAIIEAHRERVQVVEVDERVLEDIDTPETYAALLRQSLHG